MNKTTEQARKDWRRWCDSHKEEERQRHKKWYAENSVNILEKQRQRRIKNPRRAQEIEQQSKKKRRFGSLQRYNEAMLKYEGECAFACGRKATGIHHMDGNCLENSPRDKVNNDLSNLIPLCQSCHVGLHNKFRATRRIIMNGTCGDEEDFNEV